MICPKCRKRNSIKRKVNKVNGEFKDYCPACGYVYNVVQFKSRIEINSDRKEYAHGN